MLSRILPREADKKLRRLSYRPRVEALEDRILLATDVWTGAAYPNQNWSNAANWTNGVPNVGDDLVFGYSSGPDQSQNPVSINDLAPGMTLNSIYISYPHPAEFFPPNNYQPAVFAPAALEGNAINLTAGMTGASTTSVDFNVINLAADQRFIDGYIRSPVTQNGFTLFCNAGSGGQAPQFFGPFYANAPIYGGSFLSAILTAPITFYSEQGLAGGVPSAFSANLNGFDLTLVGNGSGSTSSGSITAGGSGSVNVESGTWRFGTRTDNYYTGPTNINGGATLTTEGAFTITGAINVFSGTFIENGNLNGPVSAVVAGPVNVYSGGTFVARGTVGGPVNIFGGTLDALETGLWFPWDPSQTLGSLAFDSGATFQVDLNGTTPGRDYSHVYASNIDLGDATLSATLKFNPSSAAFIILESPNPISGTFNGLPEGAALTLNNQTFYIHYFQPSPGFPARVVLVTDSRVTYTTITASQGAFPQTPLLTATVSNVGGSPVNGAAPLATGTVTFLNGDTPLSGDVPLVNGVASFIPLMQAGRRSAVAVFNPSSASYLSSNSDIEVDVNPVDMGWRDVMTGDFNGDGKQDIIGRSSAGQWFVGVSDGSSSFSNQLWTTWNEAVGWRDVQIGDFNGDGKADIAGRTASGDWWVALSNGSSFTNSF